MNAADTIQQNLKITLSVNLFYGWKFENKEEWYLTTDTGTVSTLDKNEVVATDFLIEDASDWIYDGGSILDLIETLETTESRFKVRVHLSDEGRTDAIFAVMVKFENLRYDEQSKCIFADVRLMEDAVLEYFG